ncbi:MAG: thioredoxin domain-containing protein [Terriglobales bacterium]
MSRANLKPTFLSVVAYTVFCAALATAQNVPAAPVGGPSKAASTTTGAPPAKTEPAKPKKTSAASKTVKAESVTINMPEGMTRDQADAILVELKAIHQLLQAQGAKGSAGAPPATATAAAPAPSEKVHLKMASGWHWMGRADAPVTIVEFTDYQCPFCRKYHTANFPELKKNYIDTGKVRFVSRDLPLDFHPNAQRAAEAAWCAGEQNKYWELRDTMITNSTDLSKEAIAKYAQTDALDLASFQACADADKYKAEIQKSIADAGTVGISGTPSFVIGKTSTDAIDGDRVVGAVPESVFETEIQKFMTAK